MRRIQQDARRPVIDVMIAHHLAHQVHAAMGFTDEHQLHLFTRRIWTWRDACGAERFWAQRIGQAALVRGGAALWPDLTAREEPGKEGMA